MIQIQSIKIEEINGFQILPKQGYFDLTTAKSPYSIDPFDGGIRVVPKLHINEIGNGRFYITQVCNKHSLTIKYNNNNNVRKFDSSGEIYNDAPCDAKKYFHLFFITNNVIDDPSNKFGDQVIFFDPPYMSLCSRWSEIKYDIEFETWFQFSKNRLLYQDVHPLFSFKWMLKCEAINVGNNWAITESRQSSEEDIRKSIKYYSSLDEPLLPGVLGFKNLSEAVKEFLINSCTTDL